MDHSESNSRFYLRSHPTIVMGDLRDDAVFYVAGFHHVLVVAPAGSHFDI
jgi:hypothetical protein